MGRRVKGQRGGGWGFEGEGSSDHYDCFVSSRNADTPKTVVPTQNYESGGGGTGPTPAPAGAAALTHPHGACQVLPAWTQLVLSVGSQMVGTVCALRLWYLCGWREDAGKRGPGVPSPGHGLGGGPSSPPPSCVCLGTSNAASSHQKDEDWRRGVTCHPLYPCVSAHDAPKAIPPSFPPSPPSAPPSVPTPAHSPCGPSS